MPTIESRVRASVLACAVVLAPTVAEATAITFDFTAEPDAAGLDLVAAVGGFGPIEGSFSFDDATPDAIGGDVQGFYSGAIDALSFTDTVTGNGASASSGDIAITDGDGVVAGSDIYGLDAAITTSDYGAVATLENFDLELSDSTRTALSSDALPTSPPALADFDFNFLTLSFLVSGTQSNAIYTLTSLTAASGSEPGGGDDGSGPGDTVVPLPAALPLMLGGLAALSLLRARRGA
ncbi:MAG: VPLPA-CTERM sorting domain-containing protein [Paracoccaceae bacterium]